MLKPLILIKLSAISLSLLLFLPLSVKGEDCADHFHDEKLKEKKSCLMDCVYIEIETEANQCFKLCSSFCSSPLSTRAIFFLSSYLSDFISAYHHPHGLTKAERVLVAEEPWKMFIAFRLSLSARELCFTRFDDLETGIGNSCRHFVWAILLYENFGLEFSQEVLNAHESLVDNPPEDREMDEINNELGLNIAEEMIQENSNLKHNDILQIFHEQQEQGAFIFPK